MVCYTISDWNRQGIITGSFCGTGGTRLGSNYGSSTDHIQAFQTKTSASHKAPSISSPGRDCSVAVSMLLR